MPRIRRPRRNALLAVAGGLLVAFSLPPWGLWPLAFVGIILFESSLDDGAPAGRRFRYGWLFAAGWLFVGMIWMWFLSAPGYIVASAFFAALHGLAAMVSPVGPWRVIGRPAAHTLVEALRFSFPFGGVPLASLAISQSAGPLVGVVRVGFALGVPSPAIPAFAKRVRRGASGAPHGALAIGAVIVVVVVAAVAPEGD